MRYPGAGLGQMPAAQRDKERRTRKLKTHKHTSICAYTDQFIVFLDGIWRHSLDISMEYQSRTVHVHNVYACTCVTFTHIFYGYWATISLITHIMYVESSDSLYMYMYMNSSTCS